MANSFKYNSVDMADYGLIIASHDKPFTQSTNSIQLRDYAFALDSLRPLATMTIPVWIKASNHVMLLSYFDSIKSALNYRDNKALALDIFDDRYWLARFNSISGAFLGPVAWKGEISFLLHDAAAYDNTETTGTLHTVDEDPEIITETVGGTEKTEPVYTLTSDDTLNDTTVIVENETSGETLEWTGDLVPTDILEIDVANFTVKLNDILDMFSVEGQFPSLLVGANTINVYDFSGTFQAKYRKRYV